MSGHVSTDPVSLKRQTARMSPVEKSAYLWVRHTRPIVLEDGSFLIQSIERPDRWYRVACESVRGVYDWRCTCPAIRDCWHLFHGIRAAERLLGVTAAEDAGIDWRDVPPGDESFDEWRDRTRRGAA